MAEPQIIEIFFGGRSESLRLIDEGGDIISYILGEQRLCPLIGADIKLEKKLGKGQGGTAFQITFPGMGTNEYVAKRTQRKDELDPPCLKTDFKYKKTDGSGLKMTIPAGSFACDSLYTEYIISLIVSKLYREKISSNFMDVFYFSTCPPVEGDEDSEEKEKRKKAMERNHGKHYTFMEKIDGSLRKLWIKGQITELDDIYFQILHAIGVYQENYKIVHGDLHDDNVFIKFIDPGETQYEYIVGNKTFYIPAGRVVKIGDWGLSVLYGGKNGTIIGDEHTLKTGYDQRDGQGPWLPNFYNRAYDILVITLALHDKDRSNELIKSTLAWCLKLKDGYTRDEFEEKRKNLFMSKARRPYIYSLEEFDHVTPTAVFENVPGFKKYLTKGAGESIFAGKINEIIDIVPLEIQPTQEPVIEIIGKFGEPGYKTMVNGKKESLDGFPAAITATGTQIWYKNGMVHRDGDLPAIIRSNGEKHWYSNDKLHRMTGPAKTFPDGTEEFWINDERVNAL